MTSRTSLVAQTVKRLPKMWDTWVQPLHQEDLLEKEMATHSSILAWKIPWMEEPGRLRFMGLQRVGRDWATSLTHSSSCLISGSGIATSFSQSQSCGDPGPATPGRALAPWARRPAAVSSLVSSLAVDPMSLCSRLSLRSRETSKVLTFVLNFSRLAP